MSINNGLVMLADAMPGETTSDDSFENEKALLVHHPIEVVLIDGLRTYEQVVRHVENTVGHDCNPPLEFAGRRADSWDEFMAP